MKLIKNLILAKLTYIIILLSLIFINCGTHDYLEKKQSFTNINTGISDDDFGLPVEPGGVIESEFKIKAGSVVIKVQAPSEISQVLVEITSEDIKEPIKYGLVKNNGMWKGIISNLQVGFEKTAVVNAYDNYGTLKYIGKAKFSVIGNNTLTVVIQLNDINATSNIGPFIESVEITPQKVAPGESVNLDVTAYGKDSEGGLAFKWTSSGGVFDNDTDAACLWTAPVEDGIYDLTVTVKDSNDNVNYITVEVEVDDKYKENSIPVTIESHCFHCWHYHYAPRIKKIEVYPKKAKQGETLELSVEAENYHYLNHKLTYRWEVYEKHSNMYGTFSDRHDKETFFTVHPDAPTKKVRIGVRVCNKYHCTKASKKIYIEKSNSSTPVITSITAEPGRINAGESTQLNVTTKDNDDKLKYSWSSNCSGVFDNHDKSNPVFTSSSKLDNESCLLTVIVSDGKYKTTGSVSISIMKQNSLPVVNSLTINPEEIDRNETASISVDAEDPDGNILHYLWTSTCSGSFDDNLSKSTKFTASPYAVYGNCTIIVNIDDGKGHVYGFRSLQIRKLNIPPIVNKLFANKGTLDRGESTRVFVSAIDMDGDLLAYNWTTSCQGTFDNNSSTSPIFTVGPQAEYGSCLIRVEVSDGIETESKSIPILIEDTHFNTPPEILEVFINPYKVFPGEAVDLGVKAFDADGDMLTYEWGSSCPGDFDDPTIGDPIFILPSNSSGDNCVFSVIVRDNEDLTYGFVILQIQKPNTPPVINGITADPKNPDRGEVTRLQVDVSDADGDALIYSWSAACDGKFNDVSTANPEFTVSNSADYGKCILNVVVNDGKKSILGSRSIMIEQKNYAPVIDSISANPEILSITESTQLEVSAYDPNGDTLLLYWSASCSGAFDDAAKATPVFTAGIDAGNGPCTLRVLISDGQERTSSSVIVSIEKKNFPPVINGITASPSRVDRNETTLLNVDSSDINGDVLIYNWSTDCEGTFDDETIMAPVFTVSSNAKYGECSMFVDVSDSQETVNGSLKITISKPINKLPVIVSSYQSSDTSLPEGTIQFIIKAKDPEGTSLLFDWSSTNGSLSAPVQKITEYYTESIVFWTAPKCGLDPIVVMVIVSDEDGLSTIKNFLPIDLINSGVCTDADPEIEAKLQASDMGINHKFGFSVSISGNYAVTGAYGKVNYTGAAYIYELTEGLWKEKSILHASDRQEHDFFGYSVDISGNYVIVGAMGESGGIGDTLKYSGAAYIYERNAEGHWVEEAILRASDPGKYDRFGCAVAVDGNYAIIGAKYEDGGTGDPFRNSGSAYIFKRDLNGQWRQAAKLHPSDGVVNDYFGISVALSGNHAIVGANGRDVDSKIDAGAAYIYKKESSGYWAEFSILTSPDKQESDRFGNAVSIDGNFAVVGAYMEDGGIGSPIPNSGAAYIFTKKINDNSWHASANLRASDGQAEDYFGTSVSISGDYVLIGAQREDGGNGDPVRDSGSVYLFKRQVNGVWTNRIILYAPDRESSDMFGISVSISDTHGFLGAYGEDGGSENPHPGAGSVYILNIPE